MKKMYVSQIVDLRRRGSPVVRMKDRMKKYIHKRIADRWGRIKLARRECLDRERRRIFCSGHAFGLCFQKE